MLFPGGKASASANAQEPLVAIDIGTSKIRLMAGEVDERSEVHVTYFKEVDSAGVSGSSVSDLEALTERLTSLVQSYEEENNCRLHHCFIGISGRHITSLNESGTVPVPSRKVTEVDRENAINSAQNIKFSEFNTIIHRLPQTYEIEDTKDITNPIGLSALRLKVSVHLIACNEDQVDNFKSAVERMSGDLHVDQVIFNGIAAADAVLSEAEKEIGVCLIDFGAGSVNVAVYDNNKLVLTFGLDFAGSRATRDIATKYGIPLPTAEFLKCQHGVAHPNLVSPQDQNTLLSVPIHTGPFQDKVYISRKELASDIGYNLYDVFCSIRNRIEKFTRNNNSSLPLGAGFVITGGVANTHGITQLAAVSLIPGGKNGIKVKTSIGRPRGVFSDYEDVISPECATIVGLLRYGHSAILEENRARRIAEDARRSNSIISRTSGWFKDWFKREF